MKQFNKEQCGDIRIPELENIKFPFCVDKCFQEEKTGF